jgi:hypothetical protein
VARSRTIRTLLCSAGVGAALGLALARAGAQEGQPAPAQRPSELPYETPGPLPLLSPDYRMSSHKVVLITDDALNPRRVELGKGQLVAWISYSGHPATIVFERETAKSMICHSLVNFSIKDDEIRSQPINAGEFASFCQLKPGRYKYKVVRGQPQVSGPAGVKMLEGEIVVGEVEPKPDQPG